MNKLIFNKRCFRFFWLVILIILIFYCVNGWSSELILDEYNYLGESFGYSCVGTFVSFSLKDSQGQWVSGLKLEDVQISEAIVSKTKDIIAGPYVVDIALQKEDEDTQDAGLRERSVSAEKMDIVFLIDCSGSMSEAMPGIEQEIQGLIDRLLEAHVDFRMAMVTFDEVPILWDYFRFYDCMEVKELRKEVESICQTGTEWWSPTTAYDALLFTPWLGFREEAHKISIIVTDIIPQTVYGNFWYAGGCTATTLSAVKWFLQETGIELYYCLNPDQDVDLEYYTDPDINPRAGDTQSGFVALEKMGLALPLGEPNWPFRQKNISFISPPIVNSCYYLNWQTLLPEKSIELPGNIQDYYIEIILKVKDPKNPEQTLSKTYNYPLKKKLSSINLEVTDSRGRPIDGLVAYLDYPIGNWRKNYLYQLPIDNGLLEIEEIPIGKYFLVITSGGGGEEEDASDNYSEIDYIYRQWIDVPSEGLKLEIQIPPLWRDSELAKAYGLIKDLRELEFPHAPFEEFTNHAESWLKELDEKGLTLEELVRIRRFYVPLSGYNNINEYAYWENKGAIESFSEIVRNFHQIMTKIKELQDSLETDLQEQLANIPLEIALDILTEGGFTALKESLELAVDELVNYLQNEFSRQLFLKILEQIPDSPYKPLIKSVMQSIIYEEGFDSWDSVLKAAENLGIEELVGESDKLKGEEAVKLLAEKSLQKLFLDKYYFQKVQMGLNNLLTKAQFSSLPSNIYTYYNNVVIGDDFWNCRGVVEELQEPSWKALQEQEDISEWAKNIKDLTNYLEAVITPLEALAEVYPPLQDTADALDGFIIVLDGIQIISRAIELGLQIDCLYTYGNNMESIWQAVFVE